MRFDAGPAEVCAAPDGTITWVQHRGSSDPVITGFGWGGLRVDGRAASIEAAQVQPDADELEWRAELGGSLGGSLGVVLRSSFAAGWSTRLALTNRTARPVRLDRLTLALQIATGTVGRLLCAGAEGCVAFLPARGGPVLTARVAAGSLTGASESGLELGPITLEAGARWVLALRWDWHPSPAAVLRALPITVPDPTTQQEDGLVSVSSEPDTALVLDRGAWVEGSDGSADLIGGTVGSHTLELRSARGTTTVTLRWCRSPAAVLAERTAELLAGPRTAADVVKLAAVTDALLLNRMRIAPGVGDTDEVSEALDLFTTRRAPAIQTGPWWACYLAGEFQRTGETELLGEAIEVLAVTIADARHRATVPAGVGVATMALAVALLVDGRPFAPVIASAAGLLDALPAAPDLGWWETRLATERLGGGRLGGAGGPPSRLEDIVGLGRLVGAGLPGEALQPLTAGQLAHVAAVLRLVPDRWASALGDDWGILPAELADRTTYEVTHRLTQHPDDEAYAWLVVADPPSG